MLEARILSRVAVKTVKLGALWVRIGWTCLGEGGGDAGRQRGICTFYGPRQRDWGRRGKFGTGPQHSRGSPIDEAEKITEECWRRLEKRMKRL